MDEQAAARHRTIVARLTVAMGASGILFLLPEVLVTSWRSPIPSRYIALLVMNAALGGAALVGGSALRHRRSWGWTVASSAWGAVVASSALIGLKIRIGFRGSLAGSDAVWFPRCAFGALCLLAFPDVLWTSFTLSRTDGRSGSWMASLLVLLAVSSWLGTALVLQVDPIPLRSTWLP